MRRTRKHSDEKTAECLKFFSDHPTLTCSETAMKLNLSISYTWGLAKKNKHVFKKHTNGGRTAKPKLEEIIPEGYFDFKNFSYL